MGERGLRRADPARRPVRARVVAVTGCLALLVTLASCSRAPDPADASAATSKTPTGGASSAGNRSAVRPSAPAWESASPAVPASPDRTAAGSPPGRGELEGGGFARAVPGSDAPDRTVDVGPQYAVGDDLDIEEVERLVRAVERLAGRRQLEQPQAVAGSLAAAVGTFSYRWFADGSVQPDPAWVAANIRTESVPILGRVTGHKVLFPQLRGALDEVVARGLAHEIHPEEYGGCYVPRFIGRDPGQGLSLHTWGIALDLNVPGNPRGVPGEINRDVVAIFKKWGFAWGGDWRWTDPMHFELARLVRPR